MAAYTEDQNRNYSQLLERQQQRLENLEKEMIEDGFSLSDLSENIPDLNLLAATTAFQFSPHERHLLSSNQNNRLSMISLHRSISTASVATNGNSSSSNLPKC